MMLHSEFCAVWLSLSDVTGKIASSPGPNFSQRKTQMNETAKNEGLVSIARVINGTHA